MEREHILWPAALNSRGR